MIQFADGQDSSARTGKHTIDRATQYLYYYWGQDQRAEIANHTIFWLKFDPIESV